MAPETASPTKVETGFQFLTKDFLRFWMVDICREGRSQRSAPQERHTRCTAARPDTEVGTGRGEVMLHLKRVRSSGTRQALVRFPQLLGRGRHKTQVQQSLHLSGVPENLNLSDLGLGSARNSGPAPCRATWSLSSVDRESTHAMSGASPVWPEHRESSPHRPVIFVCSAPPSPKLD